jgi:hypothetical protein
MKQLYVNHTIDIDYVGDVQHIIDDKPSTVQVYKTPHNTVNGEPTTTLAATFQGRIDSYKPRPQSSEQITMAGKVYDRTYLLLARAGKDKNGNAVIIEHGDTVLVDGTRYRCLVTFPFPEKTEAILEHVE